MLLKVYNLNKMISRICINVYITFKSSFLLHYFGILGNLQYVQFKMFFLII